MCQHLDYPSKLLRGNQFFVSNFNHENYKFFLTLCVAYKLRLERRDEWMNINFTSNCNTLKYLLHKWNFLSLLHIKENFLTSIWNFLAIRVYFSKKMPSIFQLFDISISSLIIHSEMLDLSWEMLKHWLIAFTFFCVSIQSTRQILDSRMFYLFILLTHLSFFVFAWEITWAIYIIYIARRKGAKSQEMNFRCQK